ncbi:hypothetical protein QQS21_001393 [Conoideocrella luteorostrata]|uniref:Uncharacterized protein n=1 Tax=Conoideocrella luteorostrata TaxID=1105319 RepID=A0AAJ0CX54_9HYPO|nr:hypothetical protein QQS21_001393 [Conoideocrella luteorostrata]
MYPKGYVAPNESQRASGLMEMQRQLKNWEILGPSCLVLRRSLSVASKPSFNGPFHMALLATKTLLYRALMQPATEPKAVIGSHLRTLLLEAIEDFDSLPQYLGEMSEHDLNGFWGRHARSQLVSCINFIIFLNLGAVEAGDKKLSRELLDRLACSMRRLQPLASAEARLFLAPAMMRLKSFTSNYYRRGSLEKVTPAVSIPDDDEIDMKMGEERRAEAEASVISIESGTDGDNAKLSEQN